MAYRAYLLYISTISILVAALVVLHLRCLALKKENQELRNYNTSQVLERVGKDLNCFPIEVDTE